MANENLGRHTIPLFRAPSKKCKRNIGKIFQIQGIAVPCLEARIDGNAELAILEMTSRKSCMVNSELLKITAPVDASSVLATQSPLFRCLCQQSGPVVDVTDDLGGLQLVLTIKGSGGFQLDHRVFPGDAQPKIPVLTTWQR